MIIIICSFAFYKIYVRLNNIEDLKTLHLNPIKTSFVQSLKIDELYIPSLELYCINENREKNLHEIFINEKFLIVLFSENTCNPCTELLLDYATSFERQGGKIIGLFFGENKFEAERFMKLNKIEYLFLFDKESKFLNSLEIHLIPSILFVNEKFKIINSHFLKPETNEFTIIYMDYIMAQFSSK